MSTMLFAAFTSTNVSGPVVNASSANVTRDTLSNPTYAGVQYLPTGVEWATATDGTLNYNVSRGSWLTSGNASDVWLERTTSGTLDTADPGTGRHNLGSAVSLTLSDSNPATAPNTSSVTVNFYDAASGGTLLDSVTYTLSADRTV